MGAEKGGDGGGGDVHKVKADVTREVIGGIRVGAGGCKDKSIH